MKWKKWIALGLCTVTALSSTLTMAETADVTVPEKISAEISSSEVNETVISEAEETAESDETAAPESAVDEWLEDKAVPVDANDLAGFVERLYDKCLGRKADAAGRQAWVDVLKSHRDSGAGVAFGFVFSPEYVNRNTSDDQYVSMLYEVMLGRRADAAGKESWIKLLREGLTRKYVFSGFIGSDEFTGICRRYGVERGNYQSDDIRDRQPGVTAFVVRLYQEALGRGFDPTGLTNWVNDLLTGRIKGSECAWGFLGSSEFVNKDLDDDTFIDTLYHVLFNRSSDSTGKEYWSRILLKGYSRQYVVRGFVGSQEFINLCSMYGIEAAPDAISTGEENMPYVKYPQGHYLVGTDIPAGEYVLFMDSSAAWAYYSVSEDSNENYIITNDIFFSNRIITVDNNQYFLLRGCHAVPLQLVDELNTSTEGVFKVGVHLPAGRYRVAPTNNDNIGTYRIYSDSHCKNVDSIEFFETEVYVTVQKGQYLYLENAHIVQ